MRASSPFALRRPTDSAVAAKTKKWSSWFFPVRSPQSQRAVQPARSRRALVPFPTPRLEPEQRRLRNSDAAASRFQESGFQQLPLEKRPLVRRRRLGKLGLAQSGVPNSRAVNRGPEQRNAPRRELRKPNSLALPQLPQCV